MKVVEARVLRGPNIHSEQPCFLAVVDLEDSHATSTAALPGLAERLLALLPGLSTHACDRDRPGAFVERLRSGTDWAHVLQHVLVALQEEAGVAVSFSDSHPIKGQARQHAVISGYAIERVVSEAWPLAVRIVSGLISGQTIDAAPALEELRYWGGRCALGPSTRAIVEAAERRNIPYFRITEDASLFQLGWGKHQQRIQAAMTSRTSDIAVDLASDKDLTKALLAEAGLPVPKGELARSEDEAVRAARRLGGPVALKPLDGNQGKGVSLNLTEEAQVRAAYQLASAFRRTVIVERYARGQDYRVLVVGDRVVAAARRMPAHVVGDGVLTVSELVEQENRHPLRGEGHAMPMTRIRLDECARQVLERQHLSFESVPAPGRVVVLRENANLSTGGAAEDVTDQIHPDTALACVRAAAKIGLDVAGIDLVCEDIASPLEDQGGVIIEVNAAPGLRMHQHPSKGQPHDVGGAIIDSLFPADTPARVPVIAVTGTNGKTTTTLLIGHVLQQTGLVTGVTSTEAIYINGRRIQSGDCTGYWSARTVLSDPQVEAAVLEVARGGIFKRGLAFDASDVGVVLNVQDDHLGQHGAETLEDLAHVKGLIARTANKAVVLNAEDALVARLAAGKREEAEVLFFALSPEAPVLAAHLASGGRGVYVRGEMIMLADGEHHIPLVETERLPFTLGGRARFNVANALAAVAALWALGTPLAQIVAGLSTFSSNTDQNPGRLNIFQVRDFLVIADYAHNPASYRALIETVSQLPHRRLIGVVTAPGDRYDEKLREIGRICGEGFDTVIVRQMAGALRGRPYGEAPRLILEGVLASGRDPAQVLLVLDEHEAVERAIEMGRAGDVIVIGCADTPRLLAQIAQHATALTPGGLSVTWLPEHTPAENPH